MKNESPSKPLTYLNYLKVRELIQLQNPLSDGPEHDEMLFIVIHQVYELWFKQVLHEVGYLQRSFENHDLFAGMSTLKRILTIFKTLVSQVDILETMTPLSFNSFRTRLESSSGFQSLQFREVEFRLGARNAHRVKIHPEGSEERVALEAILKEPSLYDSFLGYLASEGFPLPREVVERDRSEPNPEHPEVRRILIEIYRTRPELAQICERLVDLDEGLQEWRYRHVKMVERTIGARTGTGGSEGAGYLRSTLFKPLFPDLWTIRSEF